MSKSILLTGSRGFIGSYLTKYFSKKNYMVYCISRKNKKNKKNIFYIKCDLNKEIKLNRTFDIVIHLAAKSPINKLNSDGFKNNIRITKNLVEYLQKNRPQKIIFTSSISIYGKILDRLVNENTKKRNLDKYGKSKLECENILRDNLKYVPTISLRLPGVIGKNSVRNWLSKIMESSKKKEIINIYGLNNKFNNLIHVKELCKFIDILIKKKFIGFNNLCLGSKKPINISKILRLVETNLKTKLRIKIIKGKRKNFLIDSSKAIKKFNYNPISTEKGLIRFIKENL